MLPDKYSFRDTGESSLEDGLPWSKIDASNFKPWKKTVEQKSKGQSHPIWSNWKKKYNTSISYLKKRSTDRIKKSEVFKKIKSSIDWAKKSLKDKTKISLKATEFIAKKRKK